MISYVVDENQVFFHGPRAFPNFIVLGGVWLTLIHCVWVGDGGQEGEKEGERYV